MDGIKALAQKSLPFSRVIDFTRFRWIGEQVKGLDEFFVEVDKFVSPALLLTEDVADDGSDAFEADGATFEIISVDMAQDVFGQLKGGGIRFGRGVHSG
jgi:hypothetical protein